eukprot:g19059.t1
MCCFDFLRAFCCGRQQDAESDSSTLRELNNKLLDRVLKLEQDAAGTKPGKVDAALAVEKFDFDWESLRQVERGGESFVRSMSRDLNFPPSRKASGTYLQWRKLVFSWATRMRKCGFSVEDIGEKLFAGAFAGGHEGEQRLVQNVGFDVVSLMKALESRMTPKIENIRSDFERLLPLVVRPHGTTPKTFAMLLGIAFDREADMCAGSENDRRGEKSKINNALRGMKLKDADSKLVRKHLKDLPKDSVCRSPTTGEPLYESIEDALTGLEIKYELRFEEGERGDDVLYKGGGASEKALQELLTAVGERSSQHVDIHSARLNDHFMMNANSGGRAFLNFGNGEVDANANAAGGGSGSAGSGDPTGGGGITGDGGDKGKGKGGKKKCPYGSNCHNLSTTGKCRGGDHSKDDWVTNIRRFERNLPAEYAAWNRQRQENKAAREAEARKGGGKK